MSMSTDSPTPAAPITVFTIRIGGLAPRVDTMNYIVEKGICYLSPNTKLADSEKAARLADVGVAEALAAAIQPFMRKRHGDDVEIVVEKLEFTTSKSERARLVARMLHDTSIVRARLREGNFAPNKAPLIIASDLA